MSAPGVDREQLIAEACERVRDLINGTAEEMERIRADVRAVTGEDIVPPWPRQQTVASSVWFDVVGLGQECQAFIEAMELLRPLLEDAPARTVGSALKTADPAVAARISGLLERCGAFGLAGRE